MTNKFLSISLIISISYSLSSANTTITKEEKQQVKQIAVKVLKGFKKTFKPTLQNILHKMPANEAIKMCTFNKAVDKYSKSLPKGESLRRITSKPRNPKHIAQNEIEKEALKQIEKTRKPVIKKINQNHYQFYKPIIVKKACLKCHGSIKDIGKNNLKLLRKSYPNGKAINYKVNDVRGAFVVDIIKDFNVQN